MVAASKIEDLFGIENLCLMRGVEAARQSDRHLFLEKICVCSIASIPVIRARGTKDGVPLAAVYSWREEGEFVSQSFHLGDVLTKSERLREFMEQIIDLPLVATDHQTGVFLDRFGARPTVVYYGIERATSARDWYCNVCVLLTPPTISRRNLLKWADDGTRRS
jgi:hypothetical protein